MIKVFFVHLINNIIYFKKQQRIKKYKQELPLKILKLIFKSVEYDQCYYFIVNETITFEFRMTNGDYYGDYSISLNSEDEIGRAHV